MSRDVFDNMAGPVDTRPTRPEMPKQGAITPAHAQAFGRGVGYGRSMALVPGQPTCSYDRGCDHDHGHDPFGPEFNDHATMHDWRDDGWTVQQIRTSAPGVVPVQCLFCLFEGDVSQHRCGTLNYLAMPTLS